MLNCESKFDKTGPAHRAGFFVVYGARFAVFCNFESCEFTCNNLICGVH